MGRPLASDLAGSGLDGFHNGHGKEKGKGVIARNIVLIVGLMICMGGISACANQSTAEAKESVYWQRLAVSLQKSEQPRQRMLAAQLLGMVHWRDKVIAAESGAESATTGTAMSSIRSLLAEAAKSDDPVALSLAVQAGMQIGDESAKAVAAQHWQAIEPDNLAPRFFTGAPVDDLLAGARKITHYESHGYDQVRLMAAAFRDLPMSPAEAGSAYWKGSSDDEQRGAVSAFAIWAAFGMPTFQNLVHACKGGALASTPGRRDECLHIADVLANHSDNLLSRSIGIAILENAANTPETIASVHSLSRNQDWQRQQYSEVLSGQANEDQQIGEMLRLLKMPGVDNEIQLMEAALREAGIALTPP